MLYNKQCTKCKEIKPIAEFGKSHTTPQGKVVYIPKCKDCNRVYQLERWHKKDDLEKRKIVFKNKERYDSDWHKNYRLTSKYGITLEDFNLMYDQVFGKCTICERDVPTDMIRVDHCHKTQKVRGLLCHNCNTGLGHFKDDPALLQKAIEYLNL